MDDGIVAFTMALAFWAVIIYLVWWFITKDDDDSNNTPRFV